MIRKATEKKAVLCIDGPKPGATTGTFGQDHLTKALVTKCENYGIPFYVVPCSYTSRKCSNCGAVNAASRKETHEYECVSCGYRINAHLNAAKNIENRAETMLKAGIVYGDYSKIKNFDDFIKRHLSRQSQVRVLE